MTHEAAVALALSAAALAAAWWFLRDQQLPGDGGALADLAGPEFDSPDSGGILSNAVSTVENLMTPLSSALDDPNVAAFLVLIRTGEGTRDAGGYTRLYGGGQFSGFADHPRIYMAGPSGRTSAAGAYQITATTWDDLRRNGVDLPDFSPANQDRAAIALIKRRGALADVMAGRFDQAIAKCNREWASLPGSPYGQPTLSLDRARAVLAAAGGAFAGVA